MQHEGVNVCDQRLRTLATQSPSLTWILMILKNLSRRPKRRWTFASHLDNAGASAICRRKSFDSPLSFLTLICRSLGWRFLLAGFCVGVVVPKLPMFPRACSAVHLKIAGGVRSPPTHMQGLTWFLVAGRRSKASQKPPKAPYNVRSCGGRLRVILQQANTYTKSSVFWDRRHKRDFLLFAFLVWHFFCLVVARPKLEIRHFCKETNLQAWSICETACVCLLPWVCGSYAARTNIPIRNAQDLLLFMPRHPSHEPKGCKCFNTCLMVLCNKNTFIQCWWIWP